MNKAYQFIQREHVASIRDVQKSPSRTLRGVTRVVRGSQTIGFFFSNEEFDEMLEDLEALGGKELRKSVRETRRAIRKGRKAGTSLEKITRQYGV